jgi:superfamily II DNA or RNA helicase
MERIQEGAGVSATLAPVATFGRILSYENQWLIDAQPHVMAKARAIFVSGYSIGRSGKFTHSPISLSQNPGTGKDVQWFLSRYPLEVEPRDLEAIEQFAAEYDRRIETAAKASECTQFLLPSGALTPAYPPYDHQSSFRNFFASVRRTLLADPVAAGKTESALLTILEASARPAVVVCEPHLLTQWKKRVERFLPDATVQIIKSSKVEIQAVDVLIVGYTMLQRIEDRLIPLRLRSVIFDEIQQLRHLSTEKRRVSRALSKQADQCVGLSATPIYNLGAEIWSVIDVIAPGQLGDSNSFTREWSESTGFIRNAEALGTYLRSVGLMIRRDIKSLNRVTRDVITLDADLEALKKIEDVTRLLAISVLRNEVGESARSARDLDFKLRQATGVAKSKAVAEFVKGLLGNGSVLLAGWHREVYEIWKAFFHVNHIPFAMITGSESPAAKEAAKQAFIEGKVKVLILSLRSGAGIDGLQTSCNQVVFGELDWSPHVHDQIIGRLDRPGQTQPIQAYFMNVDDGCDPFIINLLGLKRSQHDAMIEEKSRDAEILDDVHPSGDRLRLMARGILEKLGEPIPDLTPKEGLFGEATELLQRTRIRYNSEADLQASLHGVLLGLQDCVVEREYQITSRSRIDFAITRGNERIGIECKIEQTNKASVYRQVRRYAEEGGFTQIILVAPWAGVPDFTIDGTEVTVIDLGRHQL